MPPSPFLPRMATAAAALALTVAAALAQGFSFTGDFSAGTGTFNVLADTTFTIAPNGGGFLSLLFDESTTSGPASTLLGNYFNGVQYSINGVDYSGSFTFGPRMGVTIEDTTPNDGYIYTLTPGMSPGDIVVFRQGSYTGAANSSLDLAALEGVTVSQAFIREINGRRMSDIVTTVGPEPEAYATVFATGLAGFALWRRACRACRA